MVTFDKPGQFPLSVVAHSGKQAVKQAAAVKIDAAPVGTLMAVLKVTDSGNRGEAPAAKRVGDDPRALGQERPGHFRQAASGPAGFHDRQGRARGRATHRGREELQARDCARQALGDGLRRVGGRCEESRRGRGWLGRDRSSETRRGAHRTDASGHDPRHRHDRPARALRATASSGRAGPDPRIPDRDPADERSRPIIRGRPRADGWKGKCQIPLGRPIRTVPLQRHSGGRPRRGRLRRYRECRRLAPRVATAPAANDLVPGVGGALVTRGASDRLCL